MACIDVFIERRSAVVDGVDVTGTVSGVKDNTVISDCKGKSDGRGCFDFFSKKDFLEYVMDDNVDDEADGADFERLCNAS